MVALKKISRTEPSQMPTSRSTFGPPQSPDGHAVVPVQKLSQAQMKEKCSKGLCYNYDDKQAPSHNCNLLNPS